MENKQNTVPELSDRENNNSDEINLLEYFYVLVRNKWLIILFAVVGYGVGYLLAINKGPSYIADAVIAPRESESVQMPNMSSLGLLGGMVASQFNMGGNASLDKITLLLDSRSFNEELVEKEQLLPILYSKNWDTLNNTWKKDFKPPIFIDAGGQAKSFIKYEIKNGLMTIKAKSKDSLFSFTLLSTYLRYLDIHIRNTVQQDAKENRNYLEQQLVFITDPLIRSKIQELIAKEVEKMMVISNKLSELLIRYTPAKFLRKKRFIL